MTFVFEWNTQFSHTKIGNFPDNFVFEQGHHFYTKICKFSDGFMSWTILSNIYQVDILLFLGTLLKMERERDSTNQCSTLSLIRNKYLKISKNKLTQKFHDSNELCQEQWTRFYLWFCEIGFWPWCPITVSWALNVKWLVLSVPG